MKGRTKMSNKVYNILKYLSAPVLPALATLLLGIGEIWNIPIMTPIAGTITLVATFLGTIVVKSSSDYFKDKEIIPAQTGIYGDGTDGE